MSCDFMLLAEPVCSLCYIYIVNDWHCVLDELKKYIKKDIAKLYVIKCNAL